MAAKKHFATMPLGNFSNFIPNLAVSIYDATKKIFARIKKHQALLYTEINLVLRLYTQK
jgi:hypothetical protein